MLFLPTRGFVVKNPSQLSIDPPTKGKGSLSLVLFRRVDNGDFKESLLFVEFHFFSSPDYMYKMVEVKILIRNHNRNLYGL